jgi:small subunit ribosomal protein S6e
MLHLIITQKGENDLPGITDEMEPRRLGPKRANKIRLLYNAQKGVDVRKLVIRRPIQKGDVTNYKAPKI